MSNLSDTIENLLKKSFPGYRYTKEKYVIYQNTKLFFDFYIPNLRLLIEVQGQQHFTFNKHFYKDKTQFQNQLYRDSLKTQWVAEKGYSLVSFDYDDIPKLTEEDFRNKVLEVL